MAKAKPAWSKDMIVPAQSARRVVKGPFGRFSDPAPPEIEADPWMRLAWYAPHEALRQMEKWKCEQSLLFFFERAWREIDPAPLKVNWHHECEALHLEAVTRGEIRRLVINVPPRTSKALDCNVPILTTWGWKRHGDLVVDDFVFGPDGKPKRILGVSPISVKPCSRITWDDGVSLVASDDHLWRIDRDFPYGAPGARRCRKPMVVTTSELIKTIPGRNPRSPQRPDAIALTAPIQFPPKRLLIDPYLLGVWLGDGTSSAANFTCGEEDIDHFSKYGRIAREDPGRTENAQNVFRIQLEDDFQKKLRILNILNNKHIPDDYLESSIEQRWELLRGLMDTDGCATYLGACVICLKVERLAIGLNKLACSLGLKAYYRETWSSINGKRYGPYYQSNFTPPPGTTVFKLQRKQDRLTPEKWNGRSANRYVKNVESIEPREVNCIKVEGDLYLAGEQFVTTHNTNLVNVCWPAWCWIQSNVAPLSGPQVKFMCISYGQTLSTEIATLARRLVLSEWYQGHWGDRVKILEDQGRIDNFGNTSGGFRIATSMTGSTLGRGGDVRLIDDPQSVENANSQIETENVLRTYREALQTRETDPQTSAEVIIMQRLGQNDLSGYILQKAREDVVHVMLPMRHIPEAHCTTAWFDDPRTERDELLWPEQFPAPVVNNYEQELGPFAFAGQFQQQPIPRGGGIFKAEWFEAWPPVDDNGEPPEGLIVNADGRPASPRDYQLQRARIRYPALEYVAAWVDTAHTANQQNDFCAMVVAGVFRAEGTGRIERQADGQYVRVADDIGFPKVLILGGWLKRLTIHGPPVEVPSGIDLKEWNGPAYAAQRQKDWGLVEWTHHTCKHFKVDHLGIETQAAGHELGQELHRLNSDDIWSVELVPAQRIRAGGKEARAYAVQGIISSGQVYLPTFPDGTYPTWLDPMLDQWLMFPRGTHDDAVDALVGLLWHLREVGIFERRGAWEAEQEQSVIYKPGNNRLTLPYSL